jgi:hypothetical protein
MNQTLIARNTLISSLIAKSAQQADEEKHADLCTAFELLQQAGMAPTWVGGDSVVANVPGLMSLPGNKTAPITSTEIVRSARSARRLIAACA